MNTRIISLGEFKELIKDGVWTSVDKEDNSGIVRYLVEKDGRLTCYGAPLLRPNAGRQCREGTYEKPLPVAVYDTEKLEVAETAEGILIKTEDARLSHEPVMARDFPEGIIESFTGEEDLIVVAIR